MSPWCQYGEYFKCAHADDFCILATILNMTHEHNKGNQFTLFIAFFMIDYFACYHHMLTKIIMFCF